MSGSGGRRGGGMDRTHPRAAPPRVQQRGAAAWAHICLYSGNYDPTQLRVERIKWHSGKGLFAARLSFVEHGEHWQVAIHKKAFVTVAAALPVAPVL